MQAQTDLGYVIIISNNITKVTRINTSCHHHGADNKFSLMNFLIATYLKKEQNKIRNNKPSFQNNLEHESWICTQTWITDCKKNSVAIISLIRILFVMCIAAKMQRVEMKIYLLELEYVISETCAHSSLLPMCYGSAPIYILFFHTFISGARAQWMGC